MDHHATTTREGTATLLSLPLQGEIVVPLVSLLSSLPSPALSPFSYHTTAPPEQHHQRKITTRVVVVVVVICRGALVVVPWGQSLVVEVWWCPDGGALVFFSVLFAVCFVPRTLSVEFLLFTRSTLRMWCGLKLFPTS